MTIEDYKVILRELQKIIDDAKALMTRFEVSTAAQTTSAEHHTLRELYQRAVESQKTFTHEMLDMLERQAIAG
jgi:hypothetical protein